jgi:hypothetical protein
MRKTDTWEETIIAEAIPERRKAADIYQSRGDLQASFLQMREAVCRNGRGELRELRQTRSQLICVEIPVHYQPSSGVSKIPGNFRRAFRLGLRMIRVITR